jgi:hypothetical protein
MLSSNVAGILGLLADKNVSPEQRRRITATAAALDMIAIAVGQQASGHKLAEEMARLSEYVERIETLLPLTR